MKNIEVTLLSKEEILGKSDVLQKVGTICKEEYWTKTASKPNHHYFVYGNNLIMAGPIKYACGVRPVLKTENLEELISGLEITYEENVEVVDYGIFLDFTSKLDNLPLIKPINITLNQRETEYYKIEEYEYNQRKIIVYDNGYFKRYFEVKPLKFYIDRKKNMLISKYVLFSYPIDQKNYDGNFESSQLYQYLNTEFLNILNENKLLSPSKVKKYHL